MLLEAIRGGRSSCRYQEDAASVHALQLQPEELKRTLQKLDVQWDPSKAGMDHLAGQVAFFGIYDGCVMHTGGRSSLLIQQYADSTAMAEKKSLRISRTISTA
jgi:Tfp pilus assembly protein PilO